MTGLPDRRRVFELEPNAEHISKLSVDELHIGGIKISAVQGTHYSNGRLEIAGKGDNGVEVQLVPGADCQGAGVIAQILIFSAKAASGFLRHCFSWVRDSDGNDRYVEDHSASGTRVIPPQYFNNNARTREDGSDTGGRDWLVLFGNGSDELTMQDGRRVEIRSLLDAVVQLADLHGIAVQIRPPAGQ